MTQFMTLLESMHLKPNRTQLLRFGLSLALAVLLWGWVTELQDPFTEESYFEIPIEAAEFPESLQMVTTLPNVTVEIKGASSRIDPVSRTEISVRLDTSDVTGPGTYQVPIVADVPNVSSVSVDPDEITIQVDERVSEVYPLHISTSETGEEGRSTILQAVPSVSQVTVTGPRSIVERIERVELPVGIEQQTQDFDAGFEPQAVDSSGQRISEVEILPNLILTHVTVETVGKQVSVIPSVTGVPADGYSVQQRRAIPDTIVVDGPPEILDELLFVNTEPVDITDATQSVSTRVGLADLPDGVTVIDPPSETIEVRVAIEDSTSSSQPLNDLPVHVVGVEPGLTAQVEPDTVTIQVSAALNILQSMTPQDIGVYVDVTGLGPGTYELEPVVTVPPGAMWVGSEPGTVTVTITEGTAASPASGTPPASPESG